VGFYALCGHGLQIRAIRCGTYPSHLGKIPTEVVIEDKTALEQIRLIQQLEEEDKQTIFKLIDKMLTNKKLNIFLLKM
jgi:hypothetical protein